ncbi:MAG: twin-arginine translocation signal domain-containing protein [Pseudomonadota bacterium]|nr:twin-arginine translocation signal domain-containing protein [Pseudomonadota bacterium]
MSNTNDAKDLKDCQPVSRREFLATTGTGLAALAATGCAPAQQDCIEADSKQGDTPMAKLRLTAGGYTPKDFERFIEMRLGSGEPVYWYAIGDSTTFPDGNMFMRTEGYDTGRLHSFDRDKNEAIGMTRKLIVMRDPTSGELLTGPDGEPAWVSDFTYQLFTMRLEDGFLTYESEQGSGETFNKAYGGLNRSEIQRFDGMTVFTTPVNYQIPPGAMSPTPEPVWETYDFIERSHHGGVKYNCLWAGSFPLPPFMGGGRASMHAYFKRYDRFRELPASIRDFVEEHAQLWKEPPRNIEEIRELQQ